MCLAIPARLVEYIDEDHMYGKVELGGVQRRINTSLLVGDDADRAGRVRARARGIRALTG